MKSVQEKIDLIYQFDWYGIVGLEELHILWTFGLMGIRCIVDSSILRKLKHVE